MGCPFSEKAGFSVVFWPPRLLFFQRQSVLIIQQHAALRADSDAAAGRDLQAVYLDVAGVRRDVDRATRAHYL